MSFITKTMLQSASAGAGAAASWISTLSLSATDDSARGVDVDSNGNVYICYNGNSTSLYAGVAKYDTDGNIIWRTEFSALSAPGIKIDSNDNIIICAGPTTTPNYEAVLKLSSTDGSIIWQRNIISGDFGGAFHLEIDTSDNIYVQVFELTGFFEGVAEVYKFDTNGDLLWGRNSGVDTTEFIQLQGLVAHNDGTIRSLVIYDVFSSIAIFNSTTGNYVSSQRAFLTAKFNYDLDSSSNQYMALQSTNASFDTLVILKKPADSTTNTWCVSAVAHSSGSFDVVSTEYDEINDIFYVAVSSPSFSAIGITIYAFDGTAGTLSWQKRITASGSVLTIQNSKNCLKYSAGFLYLTAIYDDGSSQVAALIKFAADGNVSDGSYGDFTVATPSVSFSSYSLTWNTNDIGRSTDPSRTTNTTEYSTNAQTLTETFTSL